MKKITVLSLLVFISVSLRAQVANLTPEMFTGIQEIQLGQLDGWKFKPGNEANWAKNDTDISNWQTLKPAQLTRHMANENGRIEGWFKLKVKLDDSFGDRQLGIRFFCWAAVDLYIDGQYIKSFGNTGSNGKPFEEFIPGERLPVPVNMKGGNEYVIAFHFVDELASYPGSGLKSNNTGLAQLIKLTGPEYDKAFSQYLKQQPIIYSIILSVSGVLTLLFLLLALQNTREKFLWLIFLFMVAVCLSTLFSLFTYGQSFPYAVQVWMVPLEDTIGSLRFLLIPLMLISIFKRKASWDLRSYLFLITVAFCFNWFPFNDFIIFGASCVGWSIYYLVSVKDSLKNATGKTILLAVFKSIRIYLLVTAVLLPVQYIAPQFVPIFIILSLILISGYYVVASRKSVTGAQWAIIIGLLLTFVCLVLALSLNVRYQSTIYPGSRFVASAVVLSFPLSLLIYVGLRFKEMLDEVVALSEEKNEILLMQNERLELEVGQRTAELNQSLEDMKATQSQLIQSEKMASLGELTAGIAHEIQNPLNFVNNFSEVSIELLDEIEEEKAKNQEPGRDELVDELLGDIKQNLEKINHHGKRADAIVKGMLQHSRSSSGQKELTDVNALADEYLRLAYHGLRAKDKTFNATLETEFDASIGKIDIVPQDIGRVILNLITNAFHAVDERKKSGEENYNPTVSVSTKRAGNDILLRVKDNGNGIPENIKAKIFQPFFTTKPTGQGTGLGLSLTYDIIKSHGGEISVEGKSGDGTIFTIQLSTKELWTQ